MELNPISSSNISRSGYDSATDSMFIEFKTGDIYKYESVPHDIFEEFLAAKSPGRYFMQYIKNTYRFKKLDVESTD